MLCLLWTPSLNTSTYIVKLKFSLCLIKYHASMKTRGEWGYSSMHFEPRDEWYTLCPCCFTLGERPPRTHYVWEWVILKASWMLWRRNQWLYQLSYPSWQCMLNFSKGFQPPKKKNEGMQSTLHDDDVYQWMIYLAHLWIIIKNSSYKLWALL
jgi:hypothetical protein